jgi:predicted deacylase
MGKATLGVACGELGVSDKFCVAAIARGVINVLRSAGALPGSAPPVAHPVLLDSSKTVESPTSGILRSVVDRDQRVSKGQLLAVVSDFFGHPLQEVHSPIDGIVLYMTATPAISEGESVACIGHLAAKASPRLP